MWRWLLVVPLVVVIGSAGGVAAQTTNNQAAAALYGSDGQLVANAELREQADQVLIALTFAGQPPLTGTHAFHIHEAGRCDAPDFATAGGIFNPFGKQHGFRNQAGPMAGDLPDLTLSPTGLARYSVTAPLVTLRPGPASLLRTGGTSLVIDAGIDDNVSQPSGNSGAHIACGVITLPGQTAPANAGGPNPSLLIGVAGLALVVGGVILRRLG